jgi:hypothetical protein
MLKKVSGTLEAPRKPEKSEVPESSRHLFQQAAKAIHRRESDKMNEPLAERRMTWRFIRGNAVQIVIGAVLVAAVSIAVFVWMPYQKELRIARAIDASGGRVEWKFCGPDWIPSFIQNGVPFLSRIDEFTGTSDSDLLRFDVGGLARLTAVGLEGTDVTDVGVERVLGLRWLTGLSFRRSKVTDAGLVHLKGLGGSSK